MQRMERDELFLYIYVMSVFIHIHYANIILCVNDIWEARGQDYPNYK